jgi:hypothetical protein
VAAALEGKAEIWFQSKGANADLDDWGTLKPMLEERFCKPLALNEVAVLLAGLIQRATESVSEFQDRCLCALQNEDMGVTAAQKGEVGYATGFQRRLKRAFLQGLRPNIRASMVGADPEAATIGDLVILARNAETLIRSAGVHVGLPGINAIAMETGEGAAAAAPTPDWGATINALTGSSDQEAIQPVVDLLNKMWSSARGGGGRGRGASRGRGRGGGGERKKLVCFRCGLLTTHRKAECYVDLEKLQRQGRGKFGAEEGNRGRGGGRGGRGRGNVSAAEQEDENSYYPEQGNE